MKKLAALLASLFFATAAHAQTQMPALGAAAAVTGTDLLAVYQGSAPLKKMTAAQMAAYVYGLASGDLTANGTGTHTLATVNGNVGSFGSATNCTTITVNAKGLITAASQTACAPPFSAVTGRATLAQLPQGLANSIWINPTGSTADMQNLAVPACANDGAHALVYVNGTGLQCATITTGTGTVTSVGASCGNVAAPNPITTSGTIDAGISIRTVSGTTDTVLAADCGNLVGYTNSGAKAVTLPQAGTAGFATRAFFQFCNYNTGTATITPTTSTIGGAPNYPLLGGTAAAPSCLGIISDGVNYSIASTPSGGSTSPGGSSGQVQYNNGGAFGGYSTITYLSNNWYLAFGDPVANANAALPVNTIACHYGFVGRKITINALAAAVTTAGSSNMQMAIYTNGANNRPSTLVGNTGNIANTSANTTVTGSLAANKEVGPGGANGDSQLWFCANQNDSTANYISIVNNSGFTSNQVGSTTASVAIASNQNNQLSGVLCQGANCQGGSSTFGTWPASLATSTWTEMSPGNTGNLQPVIAFRVN